MKIKLLTLLAVIFISSPNAGMANNFSSMEKLEGEQSLQEGVDILNGVRSLKNQLNSMVQKEVFKCQRAFGHKEYCKCLISSLPIGVDFLSFVAIISKTKNELNHKDLGEDDKILIDSIYKERDECVQKHLSIAK